MLNAEELTNLDSFRL